MAKKRTARIYWREQGGERRAYGDFRDYRDVGGKQEALKVPGEAVATTDPGLAELLMGERLKQLAKLREDLRKGRVLGTPTRTAKLGAGGSGDRAVKAELAAVYRAVAEAVPPGTDRGRLSRAAQRGGLLEQLERLTASKPPSTR